MTKKPNEERVALERLADALVEDILGVSDETILADFTEIGGEPDRHAGDMRARFEKSLFTSNKRRLAAAKAGVAANQRKGRPRLTVDLSTARARLRAALNAPSLARSLTVAARKESEISDDEIIGILDDLSELGIVPPEDGSSGGG